MASPSPTEVSLPVYAAAPLPPGWTEHRAPAGQFYYYHAESGESTYVRPSAPAPAVKEQDPNLIVPSEGATEKKSSTTTTSKKKKEKPKTKEPIPETSWMKVTTTAGNVFYTNVETKASSWTIPEEIKEQVKFYEEAEARKLEEIKMAELEQARLKAEETKRIHEAEQRRMIEAEVQKVRAEVEAEAQLRGLKRKNELSSSIEPTQSTAQSTSNPTSIHPDRQSKIAKLDSATGENDQDEEWQRQIAEEMAQEAAEQSGTTLPPQTNNPPTMAVHKNPPPPAGLTLDELKATFKAMLLEKSIDPMAPWDNELPKFVTDARYLALSSMKERRDIFDEFCKEKIRQQRAAKQAIPKVDPPQAYRSLLIEFVTSTRTLFEDFKNKHKKDPRFRNFGRDDRERERAFKNWLKELGEQKRQQLMKAEEDFQKLLIEKAILTEVDYKSFKERVKDDSRFIAITSNSSKESMWKKWVEGEQSRKKTDPEKEVEQSKASTVISQNGEEKKRKQEASLKAREEEVREMKKKLEKESSQTKNFVGKEEAEREFKSFLVDHVRDHDADWGDVRFQLTRDSRYESMKCLPSHEMKAIFTKHVDSVYSKQINTLEAYFERQVKQPLTATFSIIKENLLDLATEGDDGEEDLTRAKGIDLSSSSSSRTEEEEKLKLKRTIRRLIGGKEGRRKGLESIEEKFNQWKEGKELKARSEFDEMFKESSFIEFWGRMKKAALEDRTKKDVGSSTIQEEGDDEGEEDGGDKDLVDFREMAKSIDLNEIQSVFKNDNRWIVWNHLPEKRDSWIRSYLDQLAVPKQTVYQK
ncbi:hypothetical protein MJO28_003004 [Puccinia striiformis f. sp. tritici]|uniref:Uncharacterized protein n=1 Tax=Puccinia striiformis f. sp. tritici TaxID=168172 RepID=A0ACC0ERY1_9BASI|nr:hypothetical protein Pst134EB_006121 [Puccinia striiformis f. sp. tritici]KAI7959213.1 hypothetical protein MJO28_003004 [Puccinia striiformis f. sp. tritici]